MVRPGLRTKQGAIALNFRSVKAAMINLWKSGAKQFRGKVTGYGCVAPRYNGLVPFIIRDFQPSDFDTLWNIDQTCFPAGISYSRAELRLYMRRRASFTLVAVSQESGESDDSPSAAKKDQSLPGAGLSDARHRWLHCRGSWSSSSRPYHYYRRNSISPPGWRWIAAAPRSGGSPDLRRMPIRRAGDRGR